VRVCASITRTARALEFGREAVAVRVSHGGVSGINPSLAPPLIFIEHGNRLHRRRPISTLIRLGSNLCVP
jgi:hypothetical protein